MLALPTFLGVAQLGFSLLKNIEVINIYDEATEAYEPNFLGFLLTCTAIYVAINLLSRFEPVGIIRPPEANFEKQVSNQ